MREIKFRAWDKLESEMRERPYLELNLPSKAMDTIGDGIRVNDDFGTDRMILMQYTGLKDKNGVEIYEGDIVRLEMESGREYGCIRWDATKACFKWIENSKDQGWVILTEDTDEVREIIGNIYENPELLEASNA